DPQRQLLVLRKLLQGHRRDAPVGLQAGKTGTDRLVLAVGDGLVLGVARQRRVATTGRTLRAGRRGRGQPLGQARVTDASVARARLGLLDARLARRHERSHVLGQTRITEPPTTRPSPKLLNTRLTRRHERSHVLGQTRITEPPTTRPSPKLLN